MPIGRRTLLTATAAILGPVAQAGAQENYPVRPVKVIVPYAPGGATDIVARLVGEEMRRLLGQPFVVENRPGAFGIIAIEAMARARPDGYTLMLGNVSTNAITPVLFAPRLSIDYAREVAPVGRLADLPGIVVATTQNFAPRTLPEFVDYARKHPGELNYGSAGVGSYPHFDALLLARRAGLDMVHVPLNGGAGPMITGMLNGTVHLCVLNVASTAVHVKDGRLRALAVVSDVRLAEFPDVPTLTEAGYPGVGTIAWQALFAPSGTPRDVLEALHRGATEALRGEAVREGFARLGVRAVPNASLAEARPWLDGELAHWRTVVDEAKIDVS